MPRYFLQGTFWIHLIPLSIMSGLAIWGSFLGILATAFGLIWSLKYAILLFEARARDDVRAPVLSTEAITPTSDLRVWQLLLSILLLATLAAGAYRLTPVLGVVAIAFALLLFPPLASQVIIEHSLPSISRLIAYGRLLGAKILVANQLLIGLAIAMVLLLNSTTSLVLAVTIVLATTWLLFDGMGALLRDAANTHDISLRHDPREDRLQDTRQKAHAEFMARLHTETRMGRFADALEILHTCSDDETERREILEELLEWEPPRLGLIWGAHEVDRLAGSGRERLALNLLQRLQQVEPHIKPVSDTATLQLAHLAQHSQLPRLAATLLTDFAGRFPDNPQAPEVQLTLAHLLCVELSRCDEARPIYQQLQAQHPKVANSEQGQRLAAILNPG